MMLFKASNKDLELFITIATRGYDACRNTEVVLAVTEIMQDLAACHNYACPLDLEAMTTGPIQDVLHDLFGIRAHLNRETGQLEDFFVPRFARSYHERQGPKHDSTRADDSATKVH